MQNRDTSAALNYHESTKLAYINLTNKPPLYKSYSGLPVIPLPDDFPSPETPALKAIGAYEASGGPEPTLTTLTQLLYHCAGVTRVGHFRVAGEVHFRAAASAGGLYPVETYVVCRDIDGLEAGVYHFGPDTFQLTRLRRGDYRSHLASAAAEDRRIATSPLSVIFTMVFWRSSWKYRSRGYRYCFWDNGTVTSNLLAGAGASGLPARVVNSFIDQQVDHLLGIDGAGEAATCIVSLGASTGDSPVPSSSAALEAIGGTSIISAPGEIDYPDIRETHAATLLSNEQEVSGCQGGLGHSTPAPQSPFIPFPDPTQDSPVSAPLGQTIRERGSTRRFDHQSIPLASLAAILRHSRQGVPSDFLVNQGDSLLDLYLIVNAVEDVPNGAYFCSHEDGGLYQLKEGEFRHEAGHLGFEQALPHDASAVAFFMADLGEILERYGNRGYRAAQLEAGIVGGKLYLAAHSLGLGASGLTFYDDEVTDFFSPHAEGKSAMFVVPLGVTATVNRVRPFRSRIAMTLDAQSRGASRNQS